MYQEPSDGFLQERYPVNKKKYRYLTHERPVYTFFMSPRWNYAPLLRVIVKRKILRLTKIKLSFKSKMAILP